MVMLSSVAELEKSREELREFARKVVREVCVRCGDFDPKTVEESAWRLKGVVAPSELSALGDSR